MAKNKFVMRGSFFAALNCARRTMFIEQDVVFQPLITHPHKMPHFSSVSALRIVWCVLISVRRISICHWNIIPEKLSRDGRWEGMGPAAGNV